VISAATTAQHERCGEQDRSREDLELVERSLWWIWLAAFFLPPKCQLNFLATTTTVLSGSGGGKP